MDREELRIPRLIAYDVRPSCAPLPRRPVSSHVGFARGRRVKIRLVEQRSLLGDRCACFWYPVCRAPRWALRLSVKGSSPCEVSLDRILVSLAAAEAGSMPEIDAARYVEAIVIGQGYVYDKAPLGQPTREDASAQSMLDSPHECHSR